MGLVRLWLVGTSVKQCANMRAMRSNTPNDARWRSADAWLERLGLSGSLTIASADASFRRYFRCSLDEPWVDRHAKLHERDESLILMDAPPEREDTALFEQVTNALGSTGLPVPTVFAADHDNGFLLLTDFGNRDLLQVLQAHPEQADAWYRQAAALLHELQNAPREVVDEFPPYDEARLRTEMQLFVDWLWRQHLALEWTDTHQEQWDALTGILVESALQQPVVAVHRDFHSRNLMVTAEHEIGVIDYQDAMAGPYTYDLVSLLRDCYVDWPLSQVTAWACSWLNASRVGQDVNETQRLRWFFLMGVQRQLKAAGIFARLSIRDGKHGYLPDIPRTLNYICAIADIYPELAWIAERIEVDCLPGLADD